MFHEVKENILDLNEKIINITEIKEWHKRTKWKFYKLKIQYLKLKIPLDKLSNQMKMTVERNTEPEDRSVEIIHEEKN